MRDSNAISLRRDPRLIEAEGLKLSRDGKTLLDLPELRFDRDGPTMILGPNGAGKSLLLRCLHGLVTPDDGSITQGGHRLDTGARARQAMVFQKPVLLRRSVAGNLDFVLKRQGLTRAERAKRCAELLALGQLDGKAGQSARSLSGGEAQRLAILRALASGPMILFLDEPTSALDPAATRAVEALIVAAHQQGARVIMVTHDTGQARRLAGDVVMLHKGELMEHTPAEQFFMNPQSRAAKCFLEGRLVM